MTEHCPERIVEVRLEGADLSGTLTLRGRDAVVDTAVTETLGNGAVCGGGYVVEEAANIADGSPPELTAGVTTMPQVMHQVPGEWLPLNPATLARIRPPLAPHQIQTITARLAAAGIRNCGDVLDRGLLGMSELRMSTGQYSAVFGLVRAVTGRDIPMGYDSNPPPAH